MNQIINLNGQRVHATTAQAEACLTLTACATGFAAVKGYSPDKGYEKRPIVNYQFISRFSTTRLYERKIAALKALTFNDITIKGAKLEALSEAEQREQFETSRGLMVASMEKTLSGDRSDAHRQAHDRCYIQVCPGIKAHLFTEKVGDQTAPVLAADGLPTIQNIMINAIPISKKVIVEGTKKPVNSGIKVLMDNCLEAAINGRSVGFMTLSLKEDNFESVCIDNNVLTASELATATGKNAEDLFYILS